VVTKRGEVFVLDRSTGRPLTKVVEKPVPQGNVPGDPTARTQPFSVEMPSFVGDPVTEESMWGLTPLDQLWCRIQFRKARTDGIFTPPTDGKPWLYSPGWMGGMDWSSASVDGERQVMVATSMHIANYDRFVSHEEVRRDPKIAKTMTVQEGSPYAGLIADYFHSPLGVPCQAPPYGRLNAIDLKTRKVLWSEPLGTAQHSGPLGIPFLRVPFAIPMGTATMGGNLVTKSGLIFIGASLDQRLRAIDIRSGKELWSAPLEAPAFATPMTYVSPASGRQVVVIAVGGYTKYGPDNGRFVTAYALPQ
jgi:glucose dehydrogenase